MCGASVCFWFMPHQYKLKVKVIRRSKKLDFFLKFLHGIAWPQRGEVSLCVWLVYSLHVWRRSLGRRWGMRGLRRELSGLRRCAIPDLLVQPFGFLSVFRFTCYFKKCGICGRFHDGFFLEQTFYFFSDNGPSSCPSDSEGVLFLHISVCKLCFACDK